MFHCNPYQSAKFISHFPFPSSLRRGENNYVFTHVSKFFFKSFIRSSFLPFGEVRWGFYFSFLPTILVQIVVNTTILIELKGINIAATTGDSCPVTAK